MYDDNGDDSQRQAWARSSGVPILAAGIVSSTRWIASSSPSVHPKAIRGNVLWLDTGDEKFPELRKKEDWNHVQISFKGPRLAIRN